MIEGEGRPAQTIRQCRRIGGSSAVRQRATFDDCERARSDLRRSASGVPYATARQQRLSEFGPDQRDSHTRLDAEVRIRHNQRTVVRDGGAWLGPIALVSLLDV